MSNETELAWCAGFFDGEGYIGYHYTTPIYLQLRLEIGQKDKRVLERFRKAVGRTGVSINGPHKNGRSTRYVLGIHNDNAIKVFNLLKPYLSEVKLEQGKEAIKEYEAYRERHYSATITTVK